MSLVRCLGFADQGNPSVTQAGLNQQIVLAEVATGSYNGLSDLTLTFDTANRPQLWAIPEQQRALVRVDASDRHHPYLCPEVRPILGIDEHFDTESVTALPMDRFAIGTETMAPGRTEDMIFVVGPQNANTPGLGPLVVQETVRMPYALWPGVVARTNEGLEGLCAAGEHWLATSETVGKDAAGARFAPLGHYDTQRKSWTGYALALTLPTGRISALQCRLNPARPDAIELIAIERHYGVGHILHAWLPLTHATDGNGPAPITPMVVLNLAELMWPLVNFEGLVWGDDGKLTLLTDNHMGFVRGPTYLLEVRPAQ